MRPDTNDYLSLFLDDVPLMDTRAPAEFQRGAFPQAASLPLMSDDERAQVGTCYKQKGQAAAIALGHQLVNGAIKAQRIASWLDFAKHYPQGYLYCFRGGLRSQICQQWMQEAGCDYPRVLGGYKAMRRFLLESLEHICQDQPMLILAGHTGAAKTELLKRVSSAVDLEAHANHRGSAFGKKPDGQPPQIDFENRISIAMLKVCHKTPFMPVVLEDESNLIGRCSLPHVLRAAMAKAPVILLEAGLEERVEHSWLNYILRKSQEWQVQVGQEDAFEYFSADLLDSLLRIRKRLGGERYANILKMMETALAAHRQGDTHQHKQWIRHLLEEYYDPMYRWQWQRHEQRVIFRGGHQEVLEFLASNPSHDS